MLSFPYGENHQTTLTKHYDWPIKNGKTIKSYLLHSFLIGVMFCYAFCQLQQTMKNVGPKPFY